MSSAGLHRELWSEHDRLGTCAICLQPQATAHPLVKCAKCQVVVTHPSCYPPGPIPRQGWECDECLYAGEAEELWGDTDSVECFLCQCPRACLGGLRRSEGDRWVHGLCASVLSTTVAFDAASGRFVVVSPVEPDVGETCAMCRGGMGVLVKCEACKTRVHVTCGMSPAAVKLGYSVSDSAPSCRCPTHAASLVLKIPRTAPAKPGTVKRAKTSSPEPASSAAAPPVDAGPFVPSKYLKQRVSVFREGIVGSVVAAPASGNLKIDLDDGKTSITRPYTAVRVIPERPPGCSVCHQSSDVETILLCDGCDLEMHMGCHKPPIKTVPAGKWFCPQCREDQQLGKIADAKAKAAAASSGKKPASTAAKSPAAKKSKAAAMPSSPSAMPPPLSLKAEELVVDWARVFAETGAVQCAEMLELLARHGAADEIMSAVRAPLVRDVMPMLDKLPAHVREGANKAEYRPIAAQIMGASRAQQQQSPPSPSSTANATAAGVDEAAAAAERVVEQTLREVATTPLVVVDARRMFELCRPLYSRDFFVDFQRALERISDDAVDELDRLLDPAKRAEADYARVSKEVLRVDQQGFARVASEWHKTPYPRRPYKEITAYEPAVLPASHQSETDSMLRKLLTTKEPQCRADEACALPSRYSLVASTFETSLPCASRRVGCAASQIGRREPLELGAEVEECDTWGLDMATRKTLEATIAVRDPSGASAVIEGLIHRHVIEKSTPDMAVAVADAMAAVNYALGLSSELPEDVSTQFLSDALAWKSRFQRGDRDPSPIEILRAMQALERAVRRGMVFKIHPKGVGVRCIKPEGAVAGTYVQEYLGELYAPWRWYERQDAVKHAQKKLSFKPALPDFYNIMLERHIDDEAGYDVLFVDPVVKGNFASRLCHSCDPNCCTVVMAVDGKFVIAVYALRDIAYGEELTFDYSSVTEDEKEFKAAICLCGSARCRGSFLFYAGQGAFEAIMKTHHSFLDRTALLYEACCGDSPLSASRLARHGMLTSVLPADHPPWMRKWADLVLKYIDFEKGELERVLVETHGYSAQQAVIEVKGVGENRRQNVAVTLDKIKYFFRHAQADVPPRKWAPPLTQLRDAEAADFLWNAAGESVAFRALDSCRRAVLTGMPRDVQDAWAALVEQMEALLPKGAGNRGGMGSKAHTLAEAKEMLAGLRDAVYAAGGAVSGHVPFAESLGDVLSMHALTDTWFQASSYESVTSPPVNVRNVDIGRDSSATVMSAPKGTKPVLEFKCQPFQSVKLCTWLTEDGRLQLAKGDGKVAKAERRDMIYVFTTALGEDTVKWFAYECVADDGGAFKVGDHMVSSTALSGPTMRQLFVFYALKRAGLYGALPLVLPKLGAKGEDVTVFGPDEATIARARFVGDAASAATASSSGKGSEYHDPNKQVLSESKVYRSGFTWGQMSGWFKQTVNDPSSSLSAERRGTLSLPDIESCTAGELEKYIKTRVLMVDKLRKKPDAMWAVDWPFSFKNKAKTYGSPWFDDALDRLLGRPAVGRTERIAQMVEDRSKLTAPVEVAAAAAGAPGAAGAPAV